MSNYGCGCLCVTLACKVQDVQKDHQVPVDPTSNFLTLNLLHIKVLTYLRETLKEGTDYKSQLKATQQIHGSPLRDSVTN